MAKKYTPAHIQVENELRKGKNPLTLAPALRGHFWGARNVKPEIVVKTKHNPFIPLAILKGGKIDDKHSVSLADIDEDKTGSYKHIGNRHDKESGTFIISFKVVAQRDTSPSVSNGDGARKEKFYIPRGGRQVSLKVASQIRFPGFMGLLDRIERLPLGRVYPQSPKPPRPAVAGQQPV